MSAGGEHFPASTDTASEVSSSESVVTSVLNKDFFKKGKYRAPEEREQEAVSDMFDTMQKWPSPQRYAALALYALEHTGLIRSEDEINNQFEMLKSSLADPELAEDEAAGLADELSLVELEDLKRHAVIELLQDSAVAAEIYRSNYTARKQLEEATSGYQRLAPIKLINVLGNKGRIGQASIIGVNSTIAIAAARLEGLQLPPPPNHLHSVE